MWYKEMGKSFDSFAGNNLTQLYTNDVLTQILEIQQQIWKAEMKNKQRELEEPDPNGWGDMLLKEQK